ncbi:MULTISPECIES: CHAT domain-containing protein [Cyanophyceae]|uniref:CHAT domain-containing protein n=1 Tax=Cyanophyceae TaxID=3028117 RepID=UPI0016835B70|nr:tetratricopeptide repeat protein [Trichocoleus sp. FACHB-40]MBD2003868.1 tetratricopeptide repeat protein [Trichocoleus sp. FACHB-40]
MHYCLKSLSLATATLLLSLMSPLLPLTLKFEPLVAQAQTTQDRKAEALRLYQEGSQQFNRGQFQEALQAAQQALVIFREIGDRQGEANSLMGLGGAYGYLGQYQQAIESYQQALAIQRELGDRRGEAYSLGGLGSAYGSLRQHQQAIESHQTHQQAIESYKQALAIQRELGERRGEAYLLQNFGRTYQMMGQHKEAIAVYQQWLTIAREIGDRQGEAYSLGSLGSAYGSLGPHQWAQAIEFYQQALAIQRELSDRRGEAYLLQNFGRTYQMMGQHKEAIAVYQQWLTITREIGDQRGEATSLGSLGSAYSYLRQHQQAIEFYQQALAIQREISDRQGKASSLRSLGWSYVSLGQYREAIEIHQQSLAITRELGNRQEEAHSLRELGQAYNASGQYKEAIEVYQQALAIGREIGYWDHSAQLGLDSAYVASGRDNRSRLYRDQIEHKQQFLAGARASGDRRMEAGTLVELGKIYTTSGQYKEAIAVYQQSLAIVREIGDRRGEGYILPNLGDAYYSLGQYREAIEIYQQSLTIFRQFRDRLRPFERLSAHYVEAGTLGNLGDAYYSLGQYREALEVYQQVLAIAREVGDRFTEGDNLGNLGNVYYALRQYPEAIECYQQSLAIAREIGFSDEPQGKLLSYIGMVLAQQNQPELAIVFYKQSISIRETIRRNIREAPQKDQQTYTETVADSYRALADLLFKQDRVLEAQRVLDLLKVQELNDYLDNVRGNNNTAQGLPNLLPEQQTWENYQAVLNKAIEIGKELTQLRQLKQKGMLTPTQEQRIAQLVKAQETIRAEFNNFTRSPEVLALVTQRSPETLSQDLLLRMGDFNALQDNLRNLQQKAVLLYPLILDDRLELILTTPDSPPIRRTVQVPKKQLNETIVAFRSALQDPAADAKTPAQQLYNWLIKPLEADLKAADAQTIIYAPDAQLRYIPLAALYDGQQWLVQRYRINNITAASLTDLNTKPQRQMQVLAGAFATGRYSFTVGGQSFDFAGLPFAGTEVENLAKTIPATTQLIDKAFTPQVTVPKMDDYTVVHLATHAAFVVGTPDDSFILFGNGDRITLRDIQNWSLKNVDLVVLSACETGLGGKLGNGEEILGLGYQMQRAGARAVIASLWTVDDGGTQTLMNTFYANLKKSNTTKAEALRQTQIALITGDSTALGQAQGIFAVEHVRNSSPNVSAHLSHPYYWAPFILIGNGL